MKEKLVENISMKRKLIIGSLITFIIIAACTSSKKVQYELPDEMLPHVKIEYAKRCDEGLILYTMSCGKCHNTKERGKTIIPDFNPDELTGYTLRVSNARHESSMPDSLVTEEELGIIMTFLSYKKKNKQPTH